MRYEEMIFFGVLGLVSMVALAAIITIILQKLGEYEQLNKWRKNLNTGDVVLTRRGVVQVMGWVITSKKRKNLVVNSEDTGFFEVRIDEIYPK